MGDTVQAVRLTTGSSLYPSPYTWTIDPSYAGFNSGKPGTTEVQAVITKGGASFGRVTIPVTVVPRPILSVEEVVRTAPMGTAFNKLGLSSTVSVVAEGGTGNAQTVTGVPVTWSSTGYDPYTLTQTVRGTLNLSRFPQLSGDNIPAVAATINLTYGTVEAPTVSDYAKTYDGQSTALPMPGLPDGIRSVAISYKGTTNSGRPYSSASAPVNAGSYTATISFVMEPGYPQLSSVTAQYVIEKAVQTCPAPTNAGTYPVTVSFTMQAGTAPLDPVTSTLTITKVEQNVPNPPRASNTATNSITVTAIPRAVYSIDGGTTWQSGNTFSGLEADKNYTILVRIAEDENHTASGTRPVSGGTTDQPVDILDADMPAYSTVYNGNRQPYPYTSLLTEMEGIRSVSIMYVGTLASGKSYETSEAPVDAGTYKVRFYLVAENGYDLSAEQVYADMTISKAPQTMPAAPTIARRTPTTIALNPVPGAEYSMDGGETWQDSPKFTGLTPDTAYTFTQRMKETDNLTASDSQSVEGRTVADTGLNYEIDYRKEIVTFDPDVVEAGKDYTLTDDLPNGSEIIPGTTIYVRLVDDGTGNPGPVVMDVLPERPATPDVKVNPFDFTMNTTENMESSDDGGEAWKPCEDRQNVENRQGETLLVRIAATDNSFKSAPTTMTVPVRGAAPVLTIDNATERMDSTAAMEYSKDSGGTWIPCLDNMDLSELTNATLLVRDACDRTVIASAKM